MELNETAPQTSTTTSTRSKPSAAKTDLEASTSGSSAQHSAPERTEIQGANAITASAFGKTGYRHSFGSGRDEAPVTSPVASERALRSAAKQRDVWSVARSATHVRPLAVVRLGTTEAGLALAGLLRHRAAMLRLARPTPNRHAAERATSEVRDCRASSVQRRFPGPLRTEWWRFAAQAGPRPSARSPVPVQAAHMLRRGHRR